MTAFNTKVKVGETELLKRLLAHDYSVFTEQSKRYLPEITELNKVISKEEQEEVLKKLQLISNFDHFYFVTSIEANELGENHGIEKFLGYPADEFTMKKYLSIIHPRHLLPRNLFVYFWREQLLTGKFKMRFMDHRLITKVALQHKKGNYVLVKYMSFAFQQDENNRVLEYMNLATVLHDFNNEPYSMIMNDEKGNFMHEWEDQVKSDVKNAFLNCGLFSEMQIAILKHISKRRNPDLKMVEIAAGLNEHEENIKTQCRRAKDKINELFKMDFKETRIAFSFLLTHGLI